MNMTTPRGQRCVSTRMSASGYDNSPADISPINAPKEPRYVNYVSICRVDVH